jgi:hypothetical protein
VVQPGCSGAVVVVVVGGTVVVVVVGAALVVDPVGGRDAVPVVVPQAANKLTASAAPPSRTRRRVTLRRLPVAPQCEAAPHDDPQRVLSG